MSQFLAPVLDDSLSTPMPGVKVSCVPLTPPGSAGIRWTAVQVVPFVEVV